MKRLTLTVAIGAMAWALMPACAFAQTTSTPALIEISDDLNADGVKLRGDGSIDDDQPGADDDNSDDDIGEDGLKRRGDGSIDDDQGDDGADDNGGDRDHGRHGGRDDDNAGDDHSGRGSDHERGRDRDREGHERGRDRDREAREDRSGHGHG
jgi:hypothetical protein